MKKFYDMIIISNAFYSFHIKAYLPIVLFIFGISKIYTQNVLNSNRADSLKGKSYEQLYHSFYKTKHNDTLYGLYAKEFINKAVDEKDTLNIARGYYIITMHDKEK